jgi:hypothetical protein
VDRRVRDDDGFEAAFEMDDFPPPVSARGARRDRAHARARGGHRRVRGEAARVSLSSPARDVGALPHTSGPRRRGPLAPGGPLFSIRPRSGRRACEMVFNLTLLHDHA